MGVSRTPVEFRVRLSVTKVNDSTLSFFRGELHLRFRGSPSCLSGYQLFIYVFYGRCNQSIYRICKYYLGNLILLQNKKDNGAFEWSIKTMS